MTATGIPDVHIRCHRCDAHLTAFRTRLGWQDMARTLAAYEWNHDCDPRAEARRKSAFAQAILHPDAPIYQKLWLDWRYGTASLTAGASCKGDEQWTTSPH